MVKALLKNILGSLGYALVKKRREGASLPTSAYLQNGINVNIQGLNIDVRDRSINRKVLRIGNDCIISGNYVFEKNTGIIEIGDRTFIGGGLFVCVDRIEIGSDVMISWGCTFIDNDAHSLISSERLNDVVDWKKGLDESRIGFYKDWSKVRFKGITVRDRAWIGFNCIILKGVTIGFGAVVGAGSVVTKDVPDFAVVAGNPANVIKYTT